MTPPPSTETDPLDPRVARSKTRVLEAARELLTESGAQSLTIERIVDRSGVAKTTIYRHWNSLAEVMADMVRVHRPPMPEPDLDHGFEHALRTFVLTYIERIAVPESSWLIAAMFELNLHMPEVRQASSVERSQVGEGMRAIIGLGVQEGVLPADIDPLMVARLLSGPSIVSLLGGEAEVAVEMARYALDRFLVSYGVTARGSD